MNPPLDPLSDAMYSELRADLREIVHSIDRVHDALDAHIKDEMRQYASLSDDVAALKTKMGVLAAGVSAVVAAVTAWAGKVFF